MKQIMKIVFLLYLSPNKPKKIPPNNIPSIELLEIRARLYFDNINDLSSFINGKTEPTIPLS
ncbi:hypothetical protein ATR01nite_28160 [Acetobacter tropicalis]|uniref:Uncharacterized protein n=1 Tax=Acetobacter tropicalis TaxID=104102 RepID=A0A511FS17_9PROT|nr:hypothetical protein ATR01nite_28160 [Acetobacter tropicalis]